MTESHTPAPKAIEALPDGWSIMRDESDKLFKTITVKAPNGYAAVLTKTGRNPENVFYMLAEAMLAALAAAQAEQTKPDHALRAFVFECSKLEGGMVNGNILSAKAKLLLDQPSPPSDRGPAGTPPPVEREAIGYLSAASLRHLSEGSGTTITAEADARFNVPVYTAPPQADRADAEQIDWLAHTRSSLVFDSMSEEWVVNVSGNGYWVGGVTPRAAIDAARATQEPKP